MANCLFCKKFEKCLYRIDREFSCRDYQMRPITNADHIRQMLDEELAMLISSDWCDIVCSPETENCNMDCRDKILNWLRQEANDVDQ